MDRKQKPPLTYDQKVWTIVAVRIVSPFAWLMAS